MKKITGLIALLLIAGVAQVHAVNWEIVDVKHGDKRPGDSERQFIINLKDAGSSEVTCEQRVDEPALVNEVMGYFGETSLAGLAKKIFWDCENEPGTVGKICRYE